MFVGFLDTDRPRTGLVLRPKRRRKGQRCRRRRIAGHSFVAIEVEPFSAAEQKLEQPPIEATELKFRFGRTVEARTGCDVFGYRL